ncbi:MAG: glycosyltransferase family 4 protein [Myxococcota bacterium]|nr:glycosyltransferase family 4 protein [Myxococcota bacterium]
MSNENPIHTERPAACRTVIVSGSFQTNFSYQENIWAEYLATMGDHVTVVTAGRADEGPKRMKGFQVKWLKTRGLFSRNLYFERRVAHTVESLRPDRILWFGPPQLFGATLSRYAPLSRVPMAVFMGQNRQMHPFDWKDTSLSVGDRLTALAYQWVRMPTVTKACLRADLVVATTQETPSILAQFMTDELWVRIEPKVWCCPLGYDEQTFTFDADARLRRRRELGIETQAPVALMTSRFVAEKWPAIHFTFSALSEALDLHQDLHVMVVGFGDDEGSRRLRKTCAEHPHAHRIHCCDFAPRHQLADLFCAADFAVFARPSISCQEALGTGLRCVFSDDGTMNWLLERPDDGEMFRVGSGADLVRVIDGIVPAIRAMHPSLDMRQARAHRARRLGYGQLIQTTLRRLDEAESGAST